jgi:hemerythrin-like metal-binding protein
MSRMPHGLLPQELMIEHAEIDDQHDEIFFRIESIKESSLASGAIPHGEIADLVTYFSGHFATEERIARATGLDFSAHAKAHEQALRVFDKAGADLDSGRLDLRTFLRYLEYWFEQHIAEFDKPLGRRLGACPGSLRSHAQSSSFSAGLSA